MKPETKQTLTILILSFFIGCIASLVIGTIRQPSKLERELVPGALYPHRQTNYTTNVVTFYSNTPQE